MSSILGDDDDDAGVIALNNVRKVAKVLEKVMQDFAKLQQDVHALKEDHLRRFSNVEVGMASIGGQLAAIIGGQGKVSISMGTVSGDANISESGGTING
jgi:hypothetical protein